jgi:hypothetical protein
MELNKYKEIYEKFSKESLDCLYFFDQFIDDSIKSKIVNFLYEKNILVDYDYRLSDMVTFLDDVDNSEIYRTYGVLTCRGPFECATEEDITDARKTLGL